MFGALNSVVHADTEVSWILSSDTTWTKADSPYSLTGNLLVDNGVTLTIEAGVNVYLNEYSILVNGTLRAYGTETDKITFHGRKIEFTKHSSKWNEQEATGSIIENTIFDSTTLDTRLTSLKITRCSLYEIVIGGSSTLTYNTFNEEITGNSVGSPTISHNTILKGANLQVSGSAVISNNNFSSNYHFRISGGSATVTGNTISGYVSVTCSGVIENNTCSDGGLHVGGSSIASNNTVFGTLSVSGEATITKNLALGGVHIGSGNHVTVSNNIIKGGIDVSPSSSLDASITGNTITDGNEDGIYVSPSTFMIFVRSNHADLYIRNNTICGFSTGISVSGPETEGTFYDDVYNTVIIDGNIIVNNTYGIKSSGKGEIRNNIIAYSQTGISCNSYISVEGNLIMNNSKGISGAGDVRYNTIVNNEVGIYGSPKSIFGNNIYDNTEYNLRFGGSLAGNATDNWWGTTNSEEIAQKIYDYHEDFYMGVVDFTPFLTEPNPQAPPVQNIEIPEFPTTVILPLLLVATVAVTVYKKKIIQKTNFGVRCLNILVY